MLITRYINQNKFLPIHIAVIIVYAIIYNQLSLNNVVKGEDKKFNNFYECIFYSLMLHFTIGMIFVFPKTKLYQGISMSQVLVSFTLMQI